MEPTHREGFLQAKEYFQEQKLQFPFVPQGEKENIRIIQPALFSTRDLKISPYDIEHYIHEVLSEKVSNYVLLGFAGHGIHSRAIHYYAVTERLALFIQLSFGHTGKNQQEIRDRVDGIFHSAKLFFEKIQNADLAKDTRLLVVESDLYGQGWGWIKGLPGTIDEKQWHTGGNLLMALSDIPNQLK